MTTVRPYALVTSGAALRWERRAQAVEKIRPRAQFDGEHERYRESESWICVPHERRQACQSGTRDDGSFRDSRILTAEFAAQVLGQALVNNAPYASAGAAYRRQRLVLLPLVDTNV